MKLTKTIEWIIFAVIVVLLIIFVAQKHNRKPALTGQAPVKIGAVLSLTGAGVQDADTVKEGIDLAISDLKKQGANVEVVYADDQTDPAKTVSGVHYVESQGAQAVVGFTWDFLFNAGLPILDQTKIVGITPTNTSEVTSHGDYGFYSSPKLGDVEPLIEKFLKDNNIKTISFVGSNYSFTQIEYKNLEKAAANTGAKIVSEDWMNPGSEAQDLITMIPKVKKKNADLVFANVDDDQALSVFFERMKENGLKVPVITGETTIGRFLHDHPESIPSDYPVYSLVPRSGDAFIQYYEKNNDGKAPGEYTEYAYDSTLILYQAITKSTNGDVRGYLKNNQFKGFENTYSFDANNDITGGLWTLDLVK